MSHYTLTEAKELMKSYYEYDLRVRAYPETFKKETYNVIRAMRRAGASNKTIESLKKYRQYLIKRFIDTPY